LVTVVIPAFNAAATLDATLHSVRAQSHRELEILVVDDGSTDGTAAIVERHARSDPRLRLIRQANAGVAAARNRGIAEARAELIAPIDADDLWMPTKIEKQLSAMLAAGDDVGFAYVWQTEIDEQDTVVSTAHQPGEEGDVFLPLLAWNIVGSGSNALMRKRAAIEAGGFDATLRVNGGEGCEDLMLFVRIAKSHKVALVREHLVGYRRWRGNMSANFRQMYRSGALVKAKLLKLYPQYARQIHVGHASMCQYLFWSAVKKSDYWSAAVLGLKLIACDFPAALRVANRISFGLVRLAIGRRAKRVVKSPITHPVAFRKYDVGASRSLRETPPVIFGMTGGHLPPGWKRQRRG
jgi:hypothetical protein